MEATQKSQWIETGDIFKGAYLLCKGSQLKETRLQGRREIIFRIEGGEVQEDDLNYCTGKAFVNPLELKATLNFLRDKIANTNQKEKQNGKIPFRKNS